MTTEREYYSSYFCGVVLISSSLCFSSRRCCRRRRRLTIFKLFGATTSELNVSVRREGVASLDITIINTFFTYS